MLDQTQNETKKTPASEVLNRRLDYARYLLALTREPLETVALSGGWQSEKAFARAFRNAVGVSPAHYRNWHRG